VSWLILLISSSNRIANSVGTMMSPFRPVATLHHGSIVGGRHTVPVTVRTAPEPGAYALSFARAAGSIDDGVLLGVRVTVAVAEGRIAVGCLDGDEGTFLDEVAVDAGPSAVTVDVLADRPAATGSLVLRNVSLKGPSLVTLLRVEIVPVTPAGDACATPLSRPRAVAAWGRAYANRTADLQEKARLRRLDCLVSSFTLAWSDGLRARIVPGDQLSRVVYLSGTYEPNTLRVLRAAVSPGETMLDVGANAGIVSLAAAVWVGSAGRVIAIEPSAREFARLVDHVALNHLTNVTLVRAAVAADAGPRPLRIAAEPHVGMNTLGGSFPYASVETAAVETVDAITLDQLAARERIDRIHAIKLDVEGSEVHALAGAAAVLRDHRPVIVVEVCASALEASGSSPVALEDLLRDAGYTWFEIDDTTGELQAASSLGQGRDRNVAAVPIERAAALVDAVRRLE
jgi:FkbM family methyltransferase